MHNTDDKFRHISNQISLDAKDFVSDDVLQNCWQDLAKYRGTSSVISLSQNDTTVCAVSDSVLMRFGLIHWPLWDVAVVCKGQFSNQLYRIVNWVSIVKLFPGEYHGIGLMKITIGSRSFFVPSGIKPSPDSYWLKAMLPLLWRH